MSSGNPHGLSEISHFGSFQRVGGKAGGFINKKFFHPSSMRNQEKLWKAQTADERETRKQKEMEKRREEERHVEEMRKQLYLAGQGKASDLFVKPADEDDEAAKARRVAGQKSEQRLAVDEEKRRKALLRLVPEGAGDDRAASSDSRALARSGYSEDVLVLGHSAVWGSWFASEGHRWGFGCCKGLSRGEACPLAPQEEVPEEAASSKDKPPGKRRRQNDDAAAAAEQEAGASGGPQAAGGAGSEAQGQGTGGSGQRGGAARLEPPRAEDPSPLMDMRMFEVAERRREKKRLEEERKEAAKKSVYLNGLLVNPTEGS